MMDSTFPAHETTRKRRRWGCTCGCLVFLVGILAAIIAASYYALRPTPSQSRERWMSVSNDGFGILRLDPEDPGVGGIMRFFTQQLEKQGGAKLPEEQRKALSAGLSLLRQFSSYFVQSDVYLYFSYVPTAQAGENWVGVVQLRRLLTYLAAKSLLDQERRPKAEYWGGAQLFRLQGEGETTRALIALSREALVMSNDAQSLREALEQPQKPSPTAEQRMQRERLNEYIETFNLEKPETGEDLSAVLLNDRNQLEGYLDWVERSLGMQGLRERLERLFASQKAKLSDIQALRIGVDVASADKAKFQFGFACRQPEIARKLVPVMREVVTQALSATKNSMIKRDANVRLEGSLVILTVEMSGLKVLLEQALSAAPPPKSQTGQ